MQRAHLAAFEPICALCCGDGLSEALGLVREELADVERVEQGALQCGHCGMEYPILDGIPVLLPELREWVRGSLFHLVQRQDLSPELDSLLGDCCGPDSAWDTTRAALSSYGWDHWGARMQAQDPLCVPGSLAGLVDQLCAMGPAQPERILDIGCALGGGSLRLSQVHDQALVLGVDMNFSLLRAGQRVLRGERIQLPIRGQGLVYQPHEVDPLPPQPRVDLWCADARALPFAAGSVQAAASLNVLDSVDQPLQHLQELARVLEQGGRAWLSSPFDWATRAAPYERWLGGHSQRAEHGGDSRRVLIKLLDRGVVPLSLKAEGEGSWRLRSSARSHTSYQCWLGALARVGETEL